MEPQDYFVLLLSREGLATHLHAHSDGCSTVVLDIHKTSVAIRGAHVAGVEGLRVGHVARREQRAAVRCSRYAQQP